jgi:hypothetical protein
MGSVWGVGNWNSPPGSDAFDLRQGLARGHGKGVFSTHVLSYGFPHQAGTVDEKLYAETSAMAIIPSSAIWSAIRTLILVACSRLLTTFKASVERPVWTLRTW